MDLKRYFSSDEVPVSNKKPKLEAANPEDEEVKVESTSKGSSEGMQMSDWLEQLGQTWKTAMARFLESNGFKNLFNYVKREYTAHTCRPIPSEIFTIFRVVPFDQIKVVIVGQDPYPGPKEAMGMSFSVHRGVTVPGSLRNMYKCLTTDTNVTFTPPKHGDLTGWAEQGVFMLNACLTVRQGLANSHQKHGWEEFTDEVIRVINRECENVVFLLWGKPAQAKGARVDRKKHCVLEACHPSPLSAVKGGFFTCGHFSKTNEYLTEHGKTAIDWNKLN